jgi:hypothetical protein
MTGTELSQTVPNLPSHDEITRFDGIQYTYSHRERVNGGRMNQREG